MDGLLGTWMDGWMVSLEVNRWVGEWMDRRIDESGNSICEQTRGKKYSLS